MNWKDNCLSKPTFPRSESREQLQEQSIWRKPSAEGNCCYFPARGLFLFHLFVLLALPPSTSLGLRIGPEGGAVTSAFRGCHVQDLQTQGPSFAFGRHRLRLPCRLHPTCKGVGGVAGGKNQQTSKSHRVAPSAMSGTSA